MTAAPSPRTYTLDELHEAHAAVTRDQLITGPREGRVLFAGTPQIAADCLHTLIADGVAVAGVLTRPDAPVGRRRRLTPSPVAQAADELGLPVVKADRIDQQTLAAITAWDVDLGVVVAYGALLPRTALEALPHGWVNLHYSALPRHRGAAPVQHAILAGDATAAATVFQLETGMDTGPIHAVCEVPLSPEASAGAVLQDLTRLGSTLLTTLLPELLQGTSVPVPQRGEPTFAGKLGREDAFIDPRQEAEAVAGRINATIPEPGAWTLHGEQRIKLGPARVYEAELPEPLSRAVPGDVARAPTDRAAAHDVVVLRTAEGGVVLSAVQPAGKRMISAADWLRGLRGRVVLGGHDEEDQA
ncbi:methionyl-tRNA formyltransferase [Nesterenkonia sp. HG001]|uniref:methionyl-tRNA formyltransferase n=1 Tax=Nesterenkonia sp. HG001 TaxID=2983207 RepID=UPI002AC3BF85|nr:methionyl-tRNA formyltransferase [Nesterenkonia sp. HG001]MDZ5075960.1 methionyl-tRNA formyltransferase [Nesterenkonia sp. HG001]